MYHLPRKKAKQSETPWEENAIQKLYRANVNLKFSMALNNV